MADKPILIADPLKAVMARISEKFCKPVEAHARDIAQEIHAEIAPQGALPPEQAWLSFAPMPTDMSRVSPFYPMNPRQMEKREYIEGMVIAKNPWGEVKYSGPKLSTFEEDVLLAILALLKTVEPDSEGKTGWTYTGALRPILTAIGVKRTGGDNYRRIKDALRRLAIAGVEIQTKRGKWVMATMLTMASGDDKSSAVVVTVNPYFAEMYAAGTVNLLDLAKRAELSRPVSKALHRFATSHRGDWYGHFLTLAAAINLDMERPHFELRRQIKLAMTELRKVGVLGSRSKFAGDTVTLAIVRKQPTEITG
jgi:hypothetical protein